MGWSIEESEARMEVSQSFDLNRRLSRFSEKGDWSLNVVRKSNSDVVKNQVFGSMSHAIIAIYSGFCLIKKIVERWLFCPRLITNTVFWKRDRCRLLTVICCCSGIVTSFRWMIMEFLKSVGEAFCWVFKDGNGCSRLSSWPPCSPTGAVHLPWSSSVQPLD